MNGRKAKALRRLAGIKKITNCADRAYTYEGNSHKQDNKEPVRVAGKRWHYQRAKKDLKRGLLK